MKLVRRLAVLAAAMTTLLGVVTTTQQASAELFNPRQDWLRDASGGLFLHWGMRTAPGFRDGASWEKAITDGGWKADYWVDEAQKLNAKYLVLASFHSRLGYGRAWPSKIPGSAHTERDFLRETIDAAKAKGLHVILYMTDDPQWHAEGGWEQLDSAAYSAYKGKNVDLTTRDGFGEYSYDNIVEVMQNYPDLSGFWIDNDNAYWERNKLYERIRAERPNFLLSNNNEDTPIMDTISNEQKVGMTPAYDYPQATYTPAPRLTEACFKLPDKGSWWYTGSDQDVSAQLNLGRYVTNTGSSIKSLMAETAMINGKFPPKQEAYNTWFAQTIAPIKESIDGTEGGGYLYGGLQPGFWNDGAHGVTTIKKDQPSQQYVHVLTAPSTGNTLKVRDNGYLVGRVSDLRTGKPLRFSQRDGTLTVEGITWDANDTVLKVQTLGGQLFQWPRQLVTATASAETATAPAVNLVDGNFQNFWDNGGKLPVSLDFKLPVKLPVSSVAINQREWSVSYARSATEQSARIKDYTVSVSDDGVTWTALKTAQLPSARGVHFVDFPRTWTKFVRVEVASTWAAATAPKFFQQLKIDEVRLSF
ncbi:alpha-L-fucosidase [Amycolatopsis xylanica]|uniref:alpha-L-fucosidase n=1 Tax=Amycolatopsis xylanica TaxID=589385 RepID=A0A1H3NDN3_9PSEU|nr:alpha-L-fucosidase [Amycolatopsis xylanica]SDY86299.1 alpha-L-fucosidase [Amycolatopsis xylanica]